MSLNIITVIRASLQFEKRLYIDKSLKIIDMLPEFFEPT